MTDGAAFDEYLAEQRSDPEFERGFQGCLAMASVVARGSNVWSDTDLVRYAWWVRRAPPSLSWDDVEAALERVLDAANGREIEGDIE